jgi:hypothetical protein
MVTTVQDGTSRCMDKHIIFFYPIPFSNKLPTRLGPYVSDHGRGLLTSLLCIGLQASVHVLEKINKVFKTVAEERFIVGST